MKKALLHLLNPKLAEVLPQALAAYYKGCESRNAATEADFTAALEGNELFDAIFLETTLGEQRKFPDKVFMRPRPPILLTLGPKGTIVGLPSLARLVELPRESTLTEIFGKLDDVLDKTGRSALHPMTLNTMLFHGNRGRFDIFIKLSDEKFVKVLGSEEVFDLSQFEKIQRKGISTVYLPDKQFLGLYDRILESLELSTFETVSLNDSISLNQAALEAARGLFVATGITPKVEKMISTSVTSAVNTMKANPKLTDILAKIVSKDTSSFLSWHSTALSFLTCGMAAMIDWKSEATFTKLSLASLLHDLAADDDRLAKIATKEEAQAAGLSAAELEKVLNHPKEGSKILSGFKEVPGEVAFIVEQHHELPEGNGFPAGLESKDISPIAALFIIAHDAVMELYKSPDNFDLKQFLSTRDSERRYSKGAFGTVFRQLMAAEKK